MHEIDFLLRLQIRCRMVILNRLLKVPASAFGHWRVWLGFGSIWTVGCQRMALLLFLIFSQLFTNISSCFLTFVPASD
jgi:hypothetical protein